MSIKRKTKTKNPVNGSKFHGKGGSKIYGQGKDCEKVKTKIETRTPIDHENPKSSNDVAWYLGFPDWIESVSKFGLNAKKASLPLDRILNTNTTSKSAYSNEPSVYALHVGPTACGGTNNTSIQSAAVSLYQFVRHANSGSRNYESSDLLMYILALREVLGYAGWVSRLYRTINSYSKEDASIPYAILAAESNDVPNGDSLEEITGFHMRDILPALIKYKFRLYSHIQDFFSRLNTLAIPGTIPLLHRAVWMFSNWFRYDDINKSSIYGYIPLAFLSYNEVFTEQGGALELPRIGPVFQWFTELDAADTADQVAQSIITNIIDMGDEILGSLMFSESAGIISGDIRKAFTEDQLMSIVPPEIDAILEFRNYEEVEKQFHGARIVPFAGSIWGRVTGAHNYQIKQVINQLVDQTYTSNPTPQNEDEGFEAFPYMVDLPVDECTIDDLIESTRLAYGVERFGNDRTYYITDFYQVVAFSAVTASYHGTYGLELTFISTGSIGGFSTGADDPFLMMGILCNTDAAYPLLPVGNPYSEPDSTTTYKCSFQVVGLKFNYNLLPESQLINMHNAAIMSELGIHTLQTKK